MLTPVNHAPDPQPARPVESIRSVERALRLLRVLEAARRPMRLTDISNSADLPKATVQRLLAVLERNGFVEKRQDRYEVGVVAVPLAYAFLVGNSLTQASLPVLQELATVTEETASLYVRDRGERVVVQRVEGANPLRFAMPVTAGQRITLLLGAAGRVLAAAMPENELSELLPIIDSTTLATGQPLTVPEFLTSLEQVRRQGFAVSRDERRLGIVSVAAPVITPDRGTIAAISVTGTPDRIAPERIERLIVEVLLAARAIAERYSHM